MQLALTCSNPLLSLCPITNCANSKILTSCCSFSAPGAREELALL